MGPDSREHRVRATAQRPPLNVLPNVNPPYYTGDMAMAEIVKQARRRMSQRQKQPRFRA